MRIEFERTGGFANISTRATVNTDTLLPEDASALTELVDRIDFFNLPSVMPSIPGGADRFQYTITVESEGQRHTVEVPESAATGDMAALVGQLTALARPGGGR